MGIFGGNSRKNPEPPEFPRHEIASPPRLEKSNSASTAGSRESLRPPVQNVSPAKQAIHGEAGDQQPSPVKWGYLAAAILHIAMTCLSGTLDRAPMACVNGTFNAIAAGIMIYAVVMWKKFNSALYVRRGLTRFSAAMIATMFGLMIGQAALIATYNGHDAADEGDCVMTSIGCMKKPSKIIAICYAIMVILWVGFTYIQSVAVLNLRQFYRRTGMDVASAPRVETTMYAELQNSMTNIERPGSRPRPLKGAPKDKLAYYTTMLILAAAMYILGMEMMPTWDPVGIADLHAAIAMQFMVVSQVARGTYWGMIAQGLVLIWVLIAFSLAFADFGYKMPLNARITGGVLSLVCQIVALAYSYIYFRSHHVEDLRDRNQAARRFIGRGNGGTPEADPMTFYMAGMAQAEGTNGNVIV